MRGIVVEMPAHLGIRGVDSACDSSSCIRVPAVHGLQSGYWPRPTAIPMIRARLADLSDARIGSGLIGFDGGRGDG